VRQGRQGGVGLVQGRRRAQGSDQLGDGVHLQELHLGLEHHDPGKKITIIAPKKMNPQQAYRVFLVGLSTMGYTVVPKGNVLRVVESANAKSETVTIYKRGTPGNTDEIVRLVMRPTNVTPTTWPTRCRS
jgi:hypothetical protein